ncbi:MAG: polyprenyl synthetase family protein [Dethiobacteria bacterium]|nr:polyprenyl synthetase family protein [Bacillota bacterium]MDW7729996.1 polyprenyl synthetase family protein [Bacillota bacterium]
MVENELILVDERLREIIETAGSELRLVGRYIINNSGKKIRPALFLTAAYRSGKNLKTFIDIAVALELLHTASLLHDDVIDQASVRRGKETVHIKWSNKIAVLCGDYVLSQVYKILVEQRDWPLMDVIVNIVQNLAEGEVEQAFADYSSPGLEENYFEWIGKKSASFFAGCCEAGSLVAGDDLEEQKLWSQYGYNLGVAFQVIDDLLDYSGDKKITGKPLYGDLSNRVITLPLIRTIQTADQLTVELLTNFLKHEDENGDRLNEAVKAVLAGDGLEFTYKKAEEYAQKSIEIIYKMKSVSPEKTESLKSLTNSLLSRIK